MRIFWGYIRIYRYILVYISIYEDILDILGNMRIYLDKFRCIRIY